MKKLLNIIWLTMKWTLIAFGGFVILIFACMLFGDQSTKQHFSQWSLIGPPYQVSTPPATPSGVAFFCGK